VDRFYCPNLTEPTVQLSPDEAHHAAAVLRLRAGAAVELFDGQGRSATGKIAQVRRGDVTVAVEQVLPAEPRRGPTVHLAMAVPKGKRLDWLLEKATELGAASLRPVVFQRSVAGGEDLGPGKRPRWLGHCIAAAKQCGLNYLPRILDPLALTAYLAHASGVGRAGVPTLRILGDIGPDAVGLVDVVAKGPSGAEINVLVGPEGGLTGEERTAVVEAGFVPVRLGWTTLRIETAAIALLAAITAIRG
jgi:16S rRNA (uracil1498-N3)-methyltransferase